MEVESEEEVVKAEPSSEKKKKKKKKKETAEVRKIIHQCDKLTVGYGILVDIGSVCVMRHLTMHILHFITCQYLNS